MSALLAETHFLIIAGPTASGKSSLALDLAERENGVVINADSMQIYRDLPVLTACPSNSDVARVPHRLYQHLDGAKRCSVGHWLGLAADAVAAARAEGKLPILVGGTGLYLHAALNGISPIPDVAPDIQAKTQRDLAELGGAKMKEMLQAVDPILGARIQAGDSQRLVRALAVHRQSGKPLSEWQTKAGEGQITGKPICLALMRDRTDIYSAIDARFDLMIEAGGLSEVEALLARGLDPSLPVMKALGVRPLQEYLQGTHDLERAIYLAKRDSRHYAKRQMTWLRNNYIPEILLSEEYSQRNLDEIVSKILKFT